MLVGAVPRPFDLLSVELNLLLRGFRGGGGDLTLLPLFRVDLYIVMFERYLRAVFVMYLVLDLHAHLRVNLGRSLINFYLSRQSKSFVFCVVLL